MRRGSIIGPLILIGIGVLFLLRNFWPEIAVFDFLALYWPFLLIAWGVIRLVEILFWAAQSRPLPRNGISGGEWLLALFICLLGGSMYAAQHSEWLPRMRVWRGFVLNLGESHQYPLAPVEMPCPKNCQVVIESFRGNVRITGMSDSVVRVTGRETILSFHRPHPDLTNQQTPVQLLQQGDKMIVRPSEGQGAVLADLDITVPPNSSIQAHGRSGDFNIEDINGPVTVDGSYGGEVQLRNVGQPVRYRDPRMTFSCEAVPGAIHMTRSEVRADNVAGPVVLTARSRDVRISGFTQSLALMLDRGDIQLAPGSSVPKMDVHTRSGDIDLALPPDAKFDLSASTDRGEVHNDYGGPLNVDASTRGATISGSVAGGPQLRLETGRGDVSIRKSSTEETSFPESPQIPTSTDEPLHVEHQ
jgi:Toastrack DUF4097/LiaF transmembrane domain